MIKKTNAKTKHSKKDNKNKHTQHKINTNSEWDKNKHMDLLYVRVQGSNYLVIP